jgi:cytoskeleton protein RodZ
VVDIGADLRQARIAKKRSIEDIARATKINVSVLQAIESDAFSRVPGGLFTRGFLRAYAREVGLDPEAIVERYRAEYEPAPSGGSERTSESPEWERLGRIRLPSDDVDAEAAAARRTQLLQLSIVLLIVLLYFATWRQPKSQASSDAKQITPASVPSERETPVATSGRETTPRTAAAPTATPTPAPTWPTTMEMHAQGPCWIEATAAGQRIVARLMDAGNTQTIPLKDEVTLRIGDPAVFAFTIGGAKGRSLGQAGKAVTVRINQENYKTLLEPR